MSKSKAAPAVLTENVPAGLTAVHNNAGQKIVDNTEARAAPEREVRTETVELSGGLRQVNYL